MRAQNAERKAQNTSRPRVRTSACLHLLFYAIAFLLCADIAFAALFPQSYRIELGTYRDWFFHTGFYDPQQEPMGASYRWTGTQAEMHVDLGFATPDALFSLHSSGRPQPGKLNVLVNDRSWASTSIASERRFYRWMMPLDNQARLRVGLQSETLPTTPDDPRQLGIKLQDFEVAVPHSGLPLPAWPVFGAQILLLAALHGIGLRLGWRKAALVACELAVALAMALLLGTAAYLAPLFTLRLAVACLALLGLTVLLLPFAERLPTWAGAPAQIRMFWGLTLGACLIRLIGVLHPTFGAQDLGIQFFRLDSVITGDTVIVLPAREFAQNDTIYPAGPYLLVMPWLLLTSDRHGLFQGAWALLDGTTVFFVALLARRLGATVAGAYWAGLLYAGSLAAFGTLSYGFTAQIVGQWFILPIALLLIELFAGRLNHKEAKKDEGREDRPESRRTGKPEGQRARKFNEHLYIHTSLELHAWLLAAFLLLLSFLMHIGVALLAIAWLGCVLGLLWFARPAQRRSLFVGGGLVVGVCLLSFALFYVEALRYMTPHAGAIVERADGYSLRGATPLLWRGLRLSYGDLGLVLVPVGLLLGLFGYRALSLINDLSFTKERMMIGEGQPALLNTADSRMLIIGAWLLSALPFFVLDLIFAVQVRYIYFLIPPMLALTGLGLGALTERRRWGNLIGWAVTLSIALPNILLWFAATFAEGKISMTPLTH